MLIKLSEYMKPVRALSRPHKGVVVDNEDPEKLGRVKVEIKGLIEGAPDDLPWCIPSTLDAKTMDVPKVGDELIIEFPYNDIYAPFYGGGWHNANTKADGFDEDYPNTFGFIKDNISLLLNDKAKKGEFTVGDFKVTIKDDGSIEMSATDFVALLSGKLEIKSDADVTVEGGGAGKFVGKGGTDCGDGGSVTNVNGSQVLLAGGGNPVAVLGSQSMGTGNLGAPVISKLLEGSSKVFAPK
jgi:hypothetical protein